MNKDVNLAHSAASQSDAVTQSYRLDGKVKGILIGVAAVGINVLVYFLLPPSLLLHLGAWGYLSAFTVAAIANATVFVPVPYYPIIARLGQSFDFWGIVLGAAAGSAVGECTAYFVGKSGNNVAGEGRMNDWIRRQLQHKWRAGLFLFAFAAPPNPVFDAAGLLSGIYGVPLRLFFVSVFLGRIIRMGLVVLIGLSIMSWF